MTRFKILEKDSGKAIAELQTAEQAAGIIEKCINGGIKIKLEIEEYSKDWAEFGNGRN